MNVKNLAAEDWAESLPDGAVSVDSRDGCLLLRASSALQKTFEHLLELKKNGELDAKGEREYEAICGLDETLSRLNRELRRSAS